MLPFEVFRNTPTCSELPAIHAVKMFPYFLRTRSVVWTELGVQLVKCLRKLCEGLGLGPRLTRPLSQIISR